MFDDVRGEMEAHRHETGESTKKTLKRTFPSLGYQRNMGEIPCSQSRLLHRIVDDVQNHSIICEDSATHLKVRL